MKKDESRKGIAEEEPEEQHVSFVRSGRGKGYMCIGNREVNVSSKPKKVVVPRKPKTITEADNLIEQEAVELAKSISIEEQILQQREIMTQLKIEKQVRKDVEEGYVAERGLKMKGVPTEDPTVQSLLALRKGSKESRREHVRKEVQAGRGERLSVAQEENYEFKDISESDSDAIRSYSWSDTNKDDEQDDTEDSDMDIFDDDDDDKRDEDDATRFGVFIYNKSQELPKFTSFSSIVTCSSMEDFTNLLNDPHVHELSNLLSKPVYTDAQTTSVVVNLEGNPKVLSYVLGASKVPFGTYVDVQATDFVLKEMFLDDADHQESSPPAITTHDLSIFKQAIEQKFKEYDQKLEAFTSIDVPEAIEEAVQAKVLTEMKKQLPTHVPIAIVKFVKHRLNKNVLEVMQKNQINLFTTPSTTIANDLSDMDL
ncbi:hypothetical protein Tco_1071866, partial [Tanacetum coccineum]